LLDEAERIFGCFAGQAKVGAGRADVERIWHIKDSHGHILALASR